MSIDEIKEQLKVFQRFNFVDDGHYYWWLDKWGNHIRAQNSMTQLIHKQSNPFDAERIAPFSAKKLGMTTQEVLDMWKFENVLSTTKGTYIHLYMEHKWLKLPTYHYPVDEVISIFGYDPIAEKWDKLTKIADKFYEDYKDKIAPVGVELIMGDEDYSMGGAIDFLGYTLVDGVFGLPEGSLFILDWKSNKEIKTVNQYKQYMLGDLKHLDDINFTHYCLQLNGYQHIIEKNTSLVLNNSHYIIWMNEKNEDYVVYTTKDLKNEAIKIIKNAAIEQYGY